MSRICPGCSGPKSKRAALCAECRQKASAIGTAVVTSVSTPVAPRTPRTPMQNVIYHGRLREIAQLESPGIERGDLWAAERDLKRWALGQASEIVGRPISSSTELSEIEMEQLNDFLGDVIDNGGRSKRARARS